MPVIVFARHPGFVRARRYGNISRLSPGFLRGLGEWCHFAKFAAACSPAMRPDVQHQPCAAAP